MAHSLPPLATRGRRYSQHQVSASIAMMPRSAHTFDDTAIPHHSPTAAHERRRPTSSNMQRQDSGYESIDSRTSNSPSDASRRRKSSASSNHLVRPPPVARLARTSTAGSRSLHGSRKSTQSLHLSKSHQQHQPPLPTSFFQFPSLELDAPEIPQSPTPPPPQTTQYWTSDHTRRLEYAAIDAARHGVKGWMRRNLVPDCMVPKDGGHLDFDDDTGSVRRYRLDLDVDNNGDGPDCVEKVSKKGWQRWKKA